MCLALTFRALSPKRRHLDRFIIQGRERMTGIHDSRPERLLDEEDRNDGQDTVITSCICP